MTEEDAALLDFDSTEESHRRLRLALEGMAALSPEAAALRTLLHRASHLLEMREARGNRASELDYSEREIQFLQDLRLVAEDSLSNVVPFAQKQRGLTWQRIGDLLGVSRQAAHERYAV